MVGFLLCVVMVLHAWNPTVALPANRNPTDWNLHYYLGLSRTEGPRTGVVRYDGLTNFGGLANRSGRWTARARGKFRHVGLDVCLYACPYGCLCAPACVPAERLLCVP